MTEIRGRLYDGRSSEVREVTVTVDGLGYLQITNYELPRTRFDALKVAPRIANTPRFIDLPDGSRLESPDHEAIDLLLGKWQKSHSGILYRLESARRSIATAIVLLVVSVYLLIVYGIPAVSGTVTAMLPTSLDDSLGGEVLEQLDDLIFQRSEIAPARQEQLQELFQSLTPDIGRDFRLQFRSSTFIGANAFALPDAQVVFTDQLVALSDDDEMLASIMLHEIGHVVERHAMRSVIGQAGLSMLIFAITGDINSASTALLVMLPSFFVQSQYSRNLEWEADTYALEEMLRRGLDPNKFADIMERIMASDEVAAKNTEAREADRDRSSDNRSADGQEDASLLEYFQSHPASSRRIERFRNAGS